MNYAVGTRVRGIYYGAPFAGVITHAADDSQTRAGETYAVRLDLDCRGAFGWALGYKEGELTFRPNHRALLMPELLGRRVQGSYYGVPFTGTVVREHLDYLEILSDSEIRSPSYCRKTGTLGVSGWGTDAALQVEAL